MLNNRQIKTYHIKTYGCQMNFSDSERIKTVLQSAGLKAVKDINKADSIIFNTCSVRQSAEDRILGLKRQMLKLKKERSEKLPNTSYVLPLTILTGCMCKRSWDESIKEVRLREKKYLTKLKRQLPWVDIIIEIKDIGKLPEILGIKQSPFKKSRNYLSIPPSTELKTTAYIPISTGCNEFCTFCIVPYARGRQLDRPAREILREVKDFIAKGYKDIMLLGQSVNSWKNPEGRSPKKFLHLLKIIDNIHGNFWLSFLSSHPNYFTDDLIDYFAKSANAGKAEIEKSKKLTRGNHIRPYLNLALQSGSNKILTKMNRKYTVEKFMRICKKLREKIPHLNLSTDIIVGFPGETEKDFARTVKAMKELKFDMVYINKYSPRKGTAAELWQDNIPWKIKKRREKELTRILAKTALENNKKYLGQKARVLVEQVKDENSKYYAYGKTFDFKNIRIPLKSKMDYLFGDFVASRIERVKSWNLEGSLLN